MKKHKNEAKASSSPAGKSTKEDSIEVSTANAENRFTTEDAEKGITNEGGNASADVKKRSAKKQRGSASDKK